MRLPLAALSAIVLMLPVPLAAATTIYVDDDAPGDPGERPLQPIILIWHIDYGNIAHSGD